MRSMYLCSSLVKVASSKSVGVVGQEHLVQPSSPSLGYIQGIIWCCPFICGSLQLVSFGALFIMLQRTISIYTSRHLLRRRFARSTNMLVLNINKLTGHQSHGHIQPLYLWRPQCDEKRRLLAHQEKVHSSLHRPSWQAWHRSELCWFLGFPWRRSILSSGWTNP